jgi:hypothetical protein
MSTQRLEILRDEARYHRRRCELYRAKMHGSRPTTVERLRELERAQVAAEARLEYAEHAERERARAAAPGS